MGYELNMNIEMLDVRHVLKVIYLCFRVTDLLEYSPEELTGKNLYNLCHGEDADKLRKSHLDCKCGWKIPIA